MFASIAVELIIKWAPTKAFLPPVLLPPFLIIQDLVYPPMGVLVFLQALLILIDQKLSIAS